MLNWFCALTIGSFLMACDGSSETPEAPEAPEATEAPEAPETPAPAHGGDDAHGGDAAGSDAAQGGDAAHGGDATGSDAHGGDAHGGDAHGSGEGDLADSTTVPEGARVFFVAPADNAEVTSPLTVEMGVEGMQVQPAGALKAGTGHHHIIIDGQSIPTGTAVPADKTHIHYGQGQTSTSLELAPGEHTLTLQFANGVHLSYGPQMSTTITVTVK